MQSITTMFISSIALLMLSFLNPPPPHFFLASSDLSRNFVLFRLHSILFCAFHISCDDILDDDNGIVFAQRMGTSLIPPPLLRSLVSILKIEYYCCFMWIHIQTLNIAYLCSMYAHRSAAKTTVKRNRRLKTIATKSNTSQIDVLATVATPIACTLLSILLFSLWICLHSKSFSVLA